MSERYWITGVQLGMIKALAGSDALQDVLKSVEDEQFIGSIDPNMAQEAKPVILIGKRFKVKNEDGTSTTFQMVHSSGTLELELTKEAVQALYDYVNRPSPNISNPVIHHVREAPKSWSKRILQVMYNSSGEPLSLDDIVKLCGQAKQKPKRNSVAKILNRHLARGFIDRVQMDGRASGYRLRSSSRASASIQGGESP